MIMNNSTAANKRLALGFSTQAAMMQVINGERDPVTLEPIVKEVIKVKLPTAAEKKAAKAALAEKRLAKAAAKAAAEAAKLAEIEAKAAAKLAALPLTDEQNYAKAISIVSAKDMKATVTKYKKSAKAAADNLLMLKDLGEQFIAIKISFVKGANKKGEPTYDDVGFSRCINATPLSIVSKRDRSDCVWLHNNWNAIEAFKAEGVESNSVGYLRQLLTAANKPKPTPKPESTAGNASDDAIEGEFELVDGEPTPKLAQTIESLVVTIQGLVDASDHKMVDVLAILNASMITVIKANK
tara:strand:+ start:648 stop:1538 length:891 start_codon:yes stop_codon:yes gene_type:complete